MAALRCPVCKADNTQGPACRRCKADLSVLFAGEMERESQLSAARGHAAARRWPAFAEAVEAAHWLRADDDSRRLRLTARLLCGGRAAARALAEAAS